VRVALDATPLLTSWTGIARYTFELTSRLTERAGIEPRFFYGRGWSDEVRTAPSPVAQRWLPWVRDHVPFAYGLRRWAQSTSFRSEARGGAFDVYHAPNAVALPFDGPTVVTVHDLSWLKFPDAHPAPRVRELDRRFASGLARATAVITDAESVKQELVDLFGVSPDRVRAVPLGASARFRPMLADETEACLRRYELVHGRYVLAVGTLEPRKNLATTLRAYAALASRLRDAYPLVVVGPGGWGADTLERELERLVVAGHVRRLGFLPSEDLAAVTAGARALVYPSLYEGFGLPPLEAMACRVPVIVSNTSSLPEVVGEAGILVDPIDVDALAAAIARITEDDGERERLAGLAWARSQTFSWERCVAETVEVYRSAVAGVPAAGRR